MSGRDERGAAARFPEVVSDVPLPPGGEPDAVAAGARRVMDSFGLECWSIRLTRAVRQLGVCRHGSRVIGLSRHLIRLNPAEEVRETLLHEVAHALVGPGHAHGPVWQATACRVGAEPERCSLAARMPPGRWRALCHGCQRVAQRHRRPKKITGWYCRACGPRLGRFIWYKEEGRS